MWDGVLLFSSYIEQTVFNESYFLKVNYGRFFQLFQSTGLLRRWTPFFLISRFSSHFNSASQNILNRASSSAEIRRSSMAPMKSLTRSDKDKQIKSIICKPSRDAAHIRITNRPQRSQPPPKSSFLKQQPPSPQGHSSTTSANIFRSSQTALNLPYPRGTRRLTALEQHYGTSALSYGATTISSIPIRYRWYYFWRASLRSCCWNGRIYPGLLRRAIWCGL